MRHHQRWILIFLMMTIQACAYSQTEKKDVVYVTRTGEKYHKDGCQYLRNSSIGTTFAEAVEQGYTACSVCKPGVQRSKATTASQGNSPPQPRTPQTSTQSRTASAQCSARTKAGSRCKRTTTSASGKCWQHE